MHFTLTTAVIRMIVIGVVATQVIKTVERIVAKRES